MSKLATIRQFQYSPAAGGFLGTLISAAGKFIGKGLGIIKPKAVEVMTKTAQVAKNPAVAGALGAAGIEAVQAMMKKGGGGATGGWRTRRSRGITARELRGYRKVAGLLHREGMVSKRARGRH